MDLERYLNVNEDFSFNSANFGRINFPSERTCSSSLDSYWTAYLFEAPQRRKEKTDLRRLSDLELNRKREISSTTENTTRKSVDETDRRSEGKVMGSENGVRSSTLSYKSGCCSVDQLGSYPAEGAGSDSGSSSEKNAAECCQKTSGAVDCRNGDGGVDRGCDRGGKSPRGYSNGDSSFSDGFGKSSGCSEDISSHDAGFKNVVGVRRRSGGGSGGDETTVGSKGERHGEDQISPDRGEFSLCLGIGQSIAGPKRLNGFSFSAGSSKPFTKPGECIPSVSSCLLVSPEMEARILDSVAVTDGRDACVMAEDGCGKCTGKRMGGVMMNLSAPVAKPALEKVCFPSALQTTETNSASSLLDVTNRPTAPGKPDATRGVGANAPQPRGNQVGLLTQDSANFSLGNGCAEFGNFADEKRGSKKDLMRLEGRGAAAGDTGGLSESGSPKVRRKVGTGDCSFWPTFQLLQHPTSEASRREEKVKPQNMSSSGKDLRRFLQLHLSVEDLKATPPSLPQKTLNGTTKSQQEQQQMSRSLLTSQLSESQTINVVGMPARPKTSQWLDKGCINTTCENKYWNSSLDNNCCSSSRDEYRRPRYENETTASPSNNLSYERGEPADNNPSRDPSESVSAAKSDVIRNYELREPDLSSLRLAPDSWSVTKKRNLTLYRTRLSLPDRVSAERQAARIEAQSRYHRRCSVKFADELGQVLNTFAMIPSRQEDKMATRTWCPDCLGERTSGKTSRPCTVDSTDLIWKPLSEDDGSGYSYVMDSGGYLMSRSVTCQQHQPTGAFPSSFVIGDRRLHRDKHKSSDKTNSAPDDTVPCDCNSIAVAVSPDDVFEEDFSKYLTLPNQPSIPSLPLPVHLCFDQPVADLDTFRAKLKIGLVCLENVRIVECQSPNSSETSGAVSTAHSLELSKSLPGLPLSPTSSQQSHDTVICSIKVVNLHPIKNVLARCTDDDWLTFADLPAQFVPGVLNLGFDYDTFCFAVRKPAVSVWREEQSGREEKEEGGRKRGLGREQGREGEMSRDFGCNCERFDDVWPTAAVEFAVCYQVLGNTYWDNNGGKNFRIEWYG